MSQSDSESSGNQTTPGGNPRTFPDFDAQSLESGLKEVEALVRRHPLSSIAVAVSMGLVVGLLIRR